MNLHVREYIKNIEIIIDEKLLLSQALDELDYKIYVDPITGKEISGWKIKRVNDGYGHQIAESFKIHFDIKDCRPRFYLQEPYSVIPFHVDRGTLCSLNILLSDNLTPITFENEDVYYKSALLNTQKLHAVRTGSERRILYKISIFDKTYQELRDVLPYKLFL